MLGPVVFLMVANTEGEGVAVRDAPGSNTKLNTWPDGTPMIVIGPDRQVGGTRWKNVKDPAGDVGWVSAAYLVPLNGTTIAAETRSPTPTPPPAA